MISNAIKSFKNTEYLMYGHTYVFTIEYGGRQVERRR